MAIGSPIWPLEQLPDPPWWLSLHPWQPTRVVTVMDHEELLTTAEAVQLAGHEAANQLSVEEVELRRAAKRL